MSWSDRLYIVALAAAGVALIYLLTPGRVDAQAITTAARGSVAHDEFCPGVAVTTFTGAKAITDRKNITIQNLSSATCYASFEPFWTGTVGVDPTNPTTTGSHGYRFAAGDQGSFDFGPTIPLRVACTAATTTPSCLQVMQVK